MQYRRAFTQGGCYFFTLALQDRKQNSLVRHIDDLRQAFIEVKWRHPFEIIAVCVLPDHLHLLMCLPPNNSNYPMRLRLIKSGFSRVIPKAETVSVSRQRKNERGIWQRRYWEHEILHQQDLNAHIDYIHINPVKHGYETGKGLAIFVISSLCTNRDFAIRLGGRRYGWRFWRTVTNMVGWVENPT